MSDFIVRGNVRFEFEVEAAYSNDAAEAKIQVAIDKALKALPFPLQDIEFEFEDSEEVEE